MPHNYALVRNRAGSFPDDFHQHTLSATAVELAVENLLPGSEIKSAIGDGDHDFAAHDLAFEMSVGVVFAGAIMSIGSSRRVRRQFFEPDLVIVMQPAFVIVDEHGCGDVHGVG